MSLFQAIYNIKDDALNGLVCPIVIKLGIQTIPAVSLLIGEVTLSYFLHYGVILPSPIGIELIEFPARMVYILERKRITALLRLSLIQKFARLELMLKLSGKKRTDRT